MFDTFNILKKEWIVVALKPEILNIKEKSKNKKKKDFY